ncbi:voltage-gated chloride channel protein [Alphaproteobacteria bacterium]|nr:voltage-gated chloride channel protein [Alphaproteobacteria bacterium]
MTKKLGITFLKNYKIVNTLIFLVSMNFFIGNFIHLFCEIFYELGNMAKILISDYKIFSFLVLPILLWMSTLCCRIFAKNASGSNLDHITQAIYILKKNPENFININQLLGIRIAFVAIISSLIATFAGGSLGREGISIFIAVSFFVNIGYLFRNYLIKIALETWIYLGYAVGFAIAFLSPISAMVYICEKLIKNKSKNYLLTIFICFSSLLMIAIGIKNFPAVYQVHNINSRISFSQFISLVYLVIFCAIAVYLFRLLLNYFFKKINSIVGIKWHLIVLTLALILIIIAEIVGIYVIGGGIKTVNQAFAAENQFIYPQDFIARYVTTIITFVIGCAGGTVAPSIAMGAGLSSSFSGFFSVDLQFLMLIGMIGFLSPLLATPVTTAFVIIESTRQEYSLLIIFLPLSLIAFLSYWFFVFLEKKLLLIRKK